MTLVLPLCSARLKCSGVTQGLVGACDSVYLKAVVIIVVMASSDVGVNCITHEKDSKLKRSLYTMHILQCSVEEVHSD